MLTEIHGEAQERYGSVADAFAENFVLRDELGAAVVAYVSGRQRAAALVATLGSCLRG
jgi:hypothetical protein